MVVLEDTGKRAIACNGRRDEWQLWHGRQRRICDLQITEADKGSESHSLRQNLSPLLSRDHSIYRAGVSL